MHSETKCMHIHQLHAYSSASLRASQPTIRATHVM